MRQSALGTLSNSLLSAEPIRYPLSPVIRICKVLCGIFKDERVSKNSGRSSLPSINVYQYDRNLDDRLDELFNCLTGEEGPVDGQQLAHTFIDVQLTKFYIPYLLNNMNIVRISWVFNHRGLSFALFPVDKSNVRVQTSMYMNQAYQYNETFLNSKDNIAHLIMTGRTTNWPTATRTERNVTEWLSDTQPKLTGVA